MSQPVPHAGSEPGTEVLDAGALDAEWLAAPSRRSRFRVGLVVVLAVLLVFLGGVEVQKRWGAAGSASAGAPTARSLPAGGSLPSGVFGQPTGSAPQSQDGTASGSSTPAVIGRLVRVHGHTWTVKDLGGKTHRVTVTATTTVTRALSAATGPIRPGSSVTVVGATHGDSVAATAVTIR